MGHFIEMHFLQETGIQGWGRDDSLSIKSVNFGGTMRDYYSSQCDNFYLRKNLSSEVGEYSAELFSASRTKQFIDALLATAEKMKNAGELSSGEYDQAKSNLEAWKKNKNAAVKKATKSKGKKVPAISDGDSLKLSEDGGSSSVDEEVIDDSDAKTGKSGKVLKDVMTFLGGNGLRNAVKVVASKPALSADDKNNVRLTALKHIDASIALFGRMVADAEAGDTISDSRYLRVDGALSTSFAVTTHRSRRSVDYFSTVDDFSPNAGSGFLGSKSFTSGVYYRCKVLDLDKLIDNLYDLAGWSVEDILRACRDLFYALLNTSPKSTTTKMSGANTHINYVIANYRDHGHAKSFFDAFSKAVEDDDCLSKSKERLEAFAKKDIDHVAVFDISRDEKIADGHNRFVDAVMQVVESVVKEKVASK